MSEVGSTIEAGDVVPFSDFQGDAETPRTSKLRAPAFQEAQPASETPYPLDEQRLISDAQNDPAAFEPLYERYVDQIYRYIYRRVGNHDEAEDLTAQTFQQALAALPNYEWRGVPFGSWLYRIAGNLVIRYRRVRGREITVEYVERIVDERGSFDDPLEAILRQSSRDQLLSAMQRLNPDQQRALILKYSHGLKNHEVGALMNRTEGGIKQLVHRAMLVLREVLITEQSRRDAEADDCAIGNEQPARQTA